MHRNNTDHTEGMMLTDGQFAVARWFAKHPGTAVTIGSLAEHLTLVPYVAQNAAAMLAENRFLKRTSSDGTAPEDVIYEVHNLTDLKRLVSHESLRRTRLAERFDGSYFGAAFIEN